MAVFNPFDFFLEPYAEACPFPYETALARELRPFLETEPAGPKLADFLASVPRNPTRTIDFLISINQRLQAAIGYVIRLEPGVQTCEETLTLRTGSCRDSAWLLVQILRHLGLAARFVSGYLIQTVPDVKPIDGPAGATTDFTDLHAWTEVYLPDAGWVGLDPTSGLLAGEGHIPLACTPDVGSAAPHIKAGTLRLLAVCVPNRLAAYPDIPTMAESDARLREFDIYTWAMLSVPKATPDLPVQRLHAAIAEAAKQPELQPRYAELGFDLINGSPAEGDAVLAREQAKWAKLIKAAGIKADL